MTCKLFARCSPGKEETKLSGWCYLYCQLKLLVLPLELLSLREGAGVDQARVEHRLPVPDPAKHLQTEDRKIASVPGFMQSPIRKCLRLAEQVWSRAGSVNRKKS